MSNLYTYNDLENDMIGMLTKKQKQKLVANALNLSRSEHDSWGFGEVQACALMQKIDDSVNWCETFIKNRKKLSNIEE